MRSIIRRVSMLAVLALAAWATTVDAQRRARPRARAAATALTPRFGGHLGYSFDVEELILGAQLSYPVTPRLDLYPSFDFYAIPGAVDLWGLNFDVKFHPPSRYGALYVGGGINYSRASYYGANSSDTNLNLLVGLERRWRPRVHPYVEMKVIVGDGSSLQLVGGMSWGR